MKLANLPFLLEFIDLINFHAENEDIFCSHLFTHLDVRAIQSPDRQRAVELKIDRKNNIPVGSVEKALWWIIAV